VKNFRHQHNRPKKNTLVVGREAILHAMNEGVALEKIFMQTTVHGDVVDEIKRKAAEKGVPISKVPVEKLNNLNVSNHEGVVAQKAAVQYHDLQDVVSLVVERGDVPLFLLLDGITDIRNIGAIARSAYSFGVHALIIPEKGVGALNADAILTSAGALEELMVCRVPLLSAAVDLLHLNGIKVYGAEMKAETKVYDAPFAEPTAIIMGGEEKGVHPGLLKMCDDAFFIPMTTDFESLNVSVASGIILYEVSKKRS
jgi:23S rRNA (guanosine2251-2'-O)-methyltransferase